MFKIGCHLSISKGLAAAVKDAVSIDASVFQFFCRNPRGRGSVRFTDGQVREFADLLEHNSIGPVLAHSPFIINAASDAAETRELTAKMLAEDFELVKRVPGAMYNMHPGNFLKRTPEEGIASIAALLDGIMSEEQGFFVLLETMAGKGTEIGRSFEELRSIIDKCRFPQWMGVCLDTCHIWDGGYDIAGNLDGVLKEFDDVIGLERLKAVHLNDSLNVCGSHKDRHAVIGGGKIGTGVLQTVINHPRLKHLPFYLETPNELPGYAGEIALLRSLYKE